MPNQQCQSTEDKLFATHTHTTIVQPFFQYHPGELVPEEDFWTSWCTGRLTEADTLTIRLGATPSRPTSAHLHHPPIYYRLDALPAAQPTVSDNNNASKWTYYQRALVTHAELDGDDIE